MVEVMRMKPLTPETVKELEAMLAFAEADPAVVSFNLLDGLTVTVAQVKAILEMVKKEAS